MYTLHITNKNYSSWSLRPWLLMRACGIEFGEVLHRFTPGSPSDFRGISPSGRVPWLEDGDTVVWDSLAIAEYLAERHPGVWPTDAVARAWARSAAAEIGAAFSAVDAFFAPVVYRFRTHELSRDDARPMRRLRGLDDDAHRLRTALAPTRLIYAGQPRYSLRVRNNDFGTLEDARRRHREAHARGKQVLCRQQHLSRTTPSSPPTSTTWRR
jgi:glutathione S-transferase